MGTKQVQMEFQVVANDGVSANVTVTMGGIQKFSGALSHTAEVMPQQVLDDQQPYSLVEFDLDVNNLPDPPGEPGQYGQYTTPIDVTITVTGGSINMQATETNYNAWREFNPNYPPGDRFIIVPGSAGTSESLRIGSQPTWNGTALTDRYNFEDNVDTGSGSLLVLENEIAAYQLSMTLYSAA
jgi:hypothetical protein